MRRLVAAAVAPAALGGSVFAQSTAPTQVKEGPPAPGPVPWMQGMDAVKSDNTVLVAEDDVAQIDHRFFTPVQMATLARLSDVMMPALKGRPGAIATNTPAFLDFFVSESVPATKMLYLGGLDWLDTEAKLKYKKPFAQLNVEEVDTLVKPWMRTWMQDHYPTTPHEHFITVVHHDIRFATFNSVEFVRAAEQTGMTPWTGLFWSPLQVDVAKGYYTTASSQPTVIRRAPAAAGQTITHTRNN